MLPVFSLSYIMLPELVKHIPVVGVVRRNIKFNVKMLKFPISDTFHAHTLGREYLSACSNLDYVTNYK